MEKTKAFKIRKLTEHIEKLKGKIARLESEREKLRTEQHHERWKQIADDEAETIVWREQNGF